MFNGVLVAQEVQNGSAKGKAWFINRWLLHSASQSKWGQDTEPQFALQCIYWSVHICECYLDRKRIEKSACRSARCWNGLQDYEHEPL